MTSEALAEQTPPPELTDADVNTTGKAQGQKSRLRRYWAAWAGLGLLLACAALVAVEHRRAQAETAEASAGPSTPNARPPTVVATVGDQDRVIGPVNRRIIAHIGSGSRNTIRISGPGVEERHAEVSGNGRWTFRNNSSSPAEVNGAVVPPGKRVCISFPTLIRLSKGATIRLWLRSVSLMPPTPAPPTVPEQAIGKERTS